MVNGNLYSIVRTSKAYAIIVEADHGVTVVSVHDSKESAETAKQQIANVVQVATSSENAIVYIQETNYLSSSTKWNLPPGVRGPVSPPYIVTGKNPNGDTFVINYSGDASDVERELRTQTTRGTV